MIATPPAAPEPIVETIVEQGDWSALEDAGGLAERSARAALETASVEPTGVAICLLLTDDAEMARLNAEFRGKPTPTNVLSWPAQTMSPPATDASPSLVRTPDGRLPLGDVALGAETVAKEAQDRNLALDDHVAHLVIHGVLHLLGYDHVDDADAEVMERAERTALARLGIGDPYA